MVPFLRNVPSNVPGRPKASLCNKRRRSGLLRRALGFSRCAPPGRFGGRFEHCECVERNVYRWDVLRDVSESGISVGMLVEAGRSPDSLADCAAGRRSPSSATSVWTRAGSCEHLKRLSLLDGAGGCATRSPALAEVACPSVRIAPECATRMRAGQLRQAPLQSA